MHGEFLQSENWEKFQRSLGNETARIDGALFIRHPLKFGLTYLYCPRATKISSVEAIKKATKKSDIFIWIDPSTNYKIQDTMTKQIPNSKFKYPKQPKSSLVLDLSKSEDELLAQMHQKTRYNIRLAQKHEVEVEQSADFDTFWQLLQETNRRNKIHSHSKEHYQKLLEIGEAKLWLAKYENNPATGAITITDNDTFYYLHGASNYQIKKVMAPYLLQWEMIKYAKTHEFKYYDFWGIDECKYPGVTRFKMGFSPNTITTYSNAVLLPLNNFWFKVYNLVK